MIESEFLHSRPDEPKELCDAENREPGTLIMKHLHHRKNPPELEIHFLKNLGILALINIIPITGGIFIITQAVRGKIQIRDPGFIQGLIYILAFSAVMVSFVWVVVPLFKWMRDYTYWHFYHKSGLMWIIPTIGFFLLWIVMVVISILIGAILILVAATTFLGVLKYL